MASAGNAFFIHSGFKVEKAYEYSDSVDAGKVISQSPNGGSSAAEGSKVTIVVSQGKKSVNVPEFNLNEPYKLKNVKNTDQMSAKKKQEKLNQMWRNWCVNDTYEPGSTFKIVTAAAGLESGAVKESDTFSCPGFRIVEDRRIRCHKAGGHGGETFREGVMNSSYVPTFSASCPMPMWHS